MNIGILGTGMVGQALSVGFLAQGHQVMIGSRDPHSEKVTAWVQEQGEHASSGTFAEAAAWGEILVVCTLWSGTENALQLADAANFAGKVVIDVTNPLVFAPNAPPALALGHTDSGGEQVQRWLPQAHVVKAFNIVGAPHMVNPSFPGGPPDMFIGGNERSAKATVSQICQDFGWNVIDLGDITVARLLEPMCIAWVIYGIHSGSWNHAFKLLHP